jgi:chaperonin cofactor prefoldin
MGEELQNQINSLLNRKEELTLKLNEIKDSILRIDKVIENTTQLMNTVFVEPEDNNSESPESEEN